MKLPGMSEEFLLLALQSVLFDDVIVAVLLVLGLDIFLTNCC